MEPRCKRSLAKRSLIFWVLLIVSMALPASAVIKKQLYQARLANGGRGVGSVMLVFSNQDNPQVMVRTNTLPNEAVEKVGLQSVSGSWGTDLYGNPKQIVLCENGALVGDCTYAADGNLDLDVQVVAFMLNSAGVSVGTFTGSLLVNVGQTSNVKVVLNDGVLGQGTLARAF